LFKNQDKDKDLSSKDKVKDCILVLKESLRTRTNITGFRRRPGYQNWRGVISKDLKKIEIGWDEVQEAMEDRRSWWIRVAQCVFDAGYTRNQDYCYDYSQVYSVHVMQSYSHINASMMFNN